MPASNAVDAHIAPSRQRSAAAPIGMSAANATDRICIQATSEGAEPSSATPRRNHDWPASQFHGLPPIETAYAGPPFTPCQANPQRKYVPAATAMTQSEDSIRCAALRERPQPVLISASPAMASGIKSIENRTRPTPASESAGTASGLIRVSGARPGGPETPAPAPALRPPYPPTGTLPAALPRAGVPPPPTPAAIPRATTRIPLSS